VDVPGVQAGGDGVGRPGRTGTVRKPCRVVAVTEALLQLGGEERGGPRLGLEAVRGELVREAQRRSDQPRRGPSAAQVRLEENQLAGASPPSVAVPTEPVPRPARKPAGLRGIAAEQRDLRAGQFDLTDVLPGTVPAQLARRGRQRLVRLGVQTRGQQHPGPVEQRDPDLGVLVHDDALVDDPQGQGQVAGEELEAAEVVQRDPLQPVLAQ
jgi:hypothetical protein